jgi:hypothetical protein
MKTAPQTTAQQAQAAANLFLSNHLPDRFTADQAQLSETAKAWEVPVILAYPGLGSLGRGGAICVSTTSEAILSFTPFDEIKQAGQRTT